MAAVQTHREWVDSLPFNIEGSLKGRTIAAPTPPGFHGDLVVAVENVHVPYTDVNETWWLCTVQPSSQRRYPGSRAPVRSGVQVKFLERELRGGVLQS